MSEISYYDADLEELLRDIEDIVGKATKGKGSSRQQVR